MKDALVVEAGRDVAEEIGRGGGRVERIEREFDLPAGSFEHHADFGWLRAADHEGKKGEGEAGYKFTHKFTV